MVPNPWFKLFLYTLFHWFGIILYDIQITIKGFVTTILYNITLPDSRQYQTQVCQGSTFGHTQIFYASDFVECLNAPCWLHQDD